MGDLQALVGKKIKFAKWGDHTIFLVFKDGSCVELIPWGDCCSHCYIQDVDGASGLPGATIKSVEDLNMAPSDAEHDGTHEVLDAWGYRIQTTNGTCTIGMRLSHNGYYGGSLELSDVDFDEAIAALPFLEDFY